MLWRNAGVTHGIVLREEEISDVTLVTFQVFDKESRTGQRLACGCGGGCCIKGTPIILCFRDVGTNKVDSVLYENPDHSRNHLQVGEGFVTLMALGVPTL
jgi:hypothetical protein